MTKKDQAYSEYFKTMETLTENRRLRHLDYGKWFDENMIKLLKNPTMKEEERHHLTREILEKNGFGDMEYYGEYNDGTVKIRSDGFNVEIMIDGKVVCEEMTCETVERMNEILKEHNIKKTIVP